MRMQHGDAERRLQWSYQAALPIRALFYLSFLSGLRRFRVLVLL